MEHRGLLSGQSRGLLPTLMRGVLRLGSAGYSVASRVRRWQFDTGRLPIHRAGVPVISVGNLTTGGTGKTPIVADICRRIRAMDRRVAIISRGYGAADSGINDEALELAEQLPDVPHVQHPDRVEAARIAVEELAAEVLVMDDGFQHRWLHRDLDILVIDATCPFGFGFMLPRGYLREPLSSMRRADLVLVSRSDQVSEEKLVFIRDAVARHKRDLPCVETVHQPSMLVSLDGSQHPVTWLQGRSVIAVSAIGNPDAFERTLVGSGANVCKRIDFPDHDRFDRAARSRLIEEVTQCKSTVDAVMCTHKDFVKLATDSIAGFPLRCLRIELAFRASERELMDAIQKCIHSSVAHD